MTVNPPQNSDPPWTFLDHTADILMEVRGKTLPELFINAARGLASLLPAESTDLSGGSPAVDLYAGDREELLVAWLREILYYNQTSGFSFGNAEIQELSDTRIVARLVQKMPDPGEEPDVEIKAVTYHGLSIQETGDEFLARIVLDI